MDRKTALVLTAHADDCEFFAGGLVARLAQEGHDVIEIIATDNARGSFELDSEELVRQSRDKEAWAAARVLGKKDLVFLGHPDGFLDEVPKNELRRVYIEAIRRYRPEIVVTFDNEAPFEDHPDHRHVAVAAMEALAFSHMPLYHSEQIAEGLTPHLVPSRYFFAKAPVHANMIVDITDYLDMKIEALYAHESQMKLIIDDLRISLEATGKSPELLEMLDRDRYRPLIDMAMRTWASSTADEQDFEHGEAYRFDYPGSFVGQDLPGLEPQRYESSALGEP